MSKQVGDTITLAGMGDFSEGVKCVIVSVSPEDGRPTKVRAIERDPRLAKMGFIYEDGEYYAVEWQITPN